MCFTFALSQAVKHIIFQRLCTISVIIGVPDEVLNKPGKLTGEEYEELNEKKELNKASDSKPD